MRIPSGGRSECEGCSGEGRCPSSARPTLHRPTSQRPGPPRTLLLRSTAALLNGLGAACGMRARRARFFFFPASSSFFKGALARRLATRSSLHLFSARAGGTTCASSFFHRTFPDAPPCRAYGQLVTTAWNQLTLLAPCRTECQ